MVLDAHEGEVLGRTCWLREGWGTPAGPAGSKCRVYVRTCALKKLEEGANGGGSTPARRVSIASVSARTPAAHDHDLGGSRLPWPVTGLVGRLGLGFRFWGMSALVSAGWLDPAAAGRPRRNHPSSCRSECPGGAWSEPRPCSPVEVAANPRPVSLGLMQRPALALRGCGFASSPMRR